MSPEEALEEAMLWTSYDLLVSVDQAPAIVYRLAELGYVLVPVEADPEDIEVMFNEWLLFDGPDRAGLRSAYGLLVQRHIPEGNRE